MASTHTYDFTSAATHILDRVLANLKILLAFVLAVLGVVAAVVFFTNQRDSRAEAGRNAFFSAQKAFDLEMKHLEEAEKKASKSPPSTEILRYRKLNSDTQFPEFIKKLKEIDQAFSSTRAAFDSRMALGDLYFNHKEFEKSLPWYQKAVDSAPSSFEKALSLSSLAYSYESLKKYPEAIRHFQTALNLGEAVLKGDLLLGIARCYEGNREIEKARTSYDQIISDLPNTDYAKTAELYKLQI